MVLMCAWDLDVPKQDRGCDDEERERAHLDGEGDRVKLGRVDDRPLLHIPEPDPALLLGSQEPAPVERPRHGHDGRGAAVLLMQDLGGTG
jgi:hypothetical protein